LQVIIPVINYHLKLSKYKKELESLVDDLVEGKETHLNEAKN